MASVIFLGKNWLGQSDRVDVSGVKDTAFSNSFDLTKLSTEELQMLKEISLKANANVDGTTEIGSNRKRTRKKTTSRAKKSER